MDRLLNTYPITIELPVAWGEMDALEHVNNIFYFRYFESARMAYFDEIEMWALMKETGVGPILKSTRCDFKHPLTYPDTLTVGAKVSAMADDRFTMQYAVASHRHRKIAATGEGVLVTFNYRKKQKTPMPQALKQRIMALESKADSP